jgi:hypothetical protein
MLAHCNDPPLCLFSLFRDGQGDSFAHAINFVAELVETNLELLGLILVLEYELYGLRQAPY